MSVKRFAGFRGSGSGGSSSKRVVVTGFVVLMVLFAGCGGNSGGGPTTGTGGESPSGSTVSEPSMQTATTSAQSNPTTSKRSSPTANEQSMTTAGEPSSRTATVSKTDRQDGGSPTARTTVSETGTRDSGSPTVRTTTVQSNRTAATSAKGLDVRIEPAVANATDVTLVLHSTVTAAAATDGIESITVDAGGGLDLSNVTVANVNTAGIDDGGTLPGNRIDGSLAANVEGGIDIADEGERFTIPFDGNRNIERGDEIVVVIEGGIATEAPGSYTFALTINDGPTQTDTYNITES